MQVPGLHIKENAISKEEEKELINWIDQQTWFRFQNRCVQHYGYEYNYYSRNCSKTQEIPEILLKLIEKLQFANFSPNQILINEYKPGQGINPHKDADCFGPEIATLSLGSQAIMEFTDAYRHTVNILLQRRTLAIMTGESRYEWTHCIPSRKTDTINRKRIPRMRRISITFRTYKN